MSIVKYQSRVKEQDSNGCISTLIYLGKQEEALSIQANHPIGEQGDAGRLKSNRVYQESPNLWACELRYESDVNGQYATAPNTAYGKKSAQLKGSMLSMPLESHPDYRTCWNYYLAASPGTSAVPSWWATAKDTTLSNTDAQKYRWVKSPSECPMDKKGLWRIIKAPEMPGVESYDVATYSITESARFGSPTSAGNFVSNRLNKIGSPSTTFSISGGTWKCDDASVSWSGKYWLATLTWTKSGNDKGWNTKLYNKK